MTDLRETQNPIRQLIHQMNEQENEDNAMVVANAMNFYSATAKRRIWTAGDVINLFQIIQIALDGQLAGQHPDQYGKRNNGPA